VQRLNSSRDRDAGSSLAGELGCKFGRSLAHAPVRCRSENLENGALIGRKVMYSRVG